MKYPLIALVLLSLALTACIVEPYGGGGRDHPPHGDWNR
jgi:hypothetical protein